MDPNTKWAPDDQLYSSLKSGGKVNKRGYHQLSDSGSGSSPEIAMRKCANVVCPSETEAASSTELSDWDWATPDSDSEYDESPTCNVCDRSFNSDRKLVQHQLRKRNYGCSVCDSIFPDLTTLEVHKESLEHWSEDEDDYRDDVTEPEKDEEPEDDDEEDEELEKLL